MDTFFLLIYSFETLFKTVLTSAKPLCEVSVQYTNWELRAQQRQPAWQRRGFGWRRSDNEINDCFKYLFVTFRSGVFTQNWDLVENPESGNQADEPDLFCPLFCDAGASLRNVSRRDRARSVKREVNVRSSVFQV